MCVLTIVVLFDIMCWVGKVDRIRRNKNCKENAKFLTRICNAYDYACGVQQ